jgi:polyhydroxybutyrate depolymerase
MRNRIGYIVATVVLCLCCLPCWAGRFVADSVKVDGHMRHFTMYLPDGLKNDAPLEFILHGYGAGMWRENPMLRAADRHGFAVCLPKGLEDPQGAPSWNVGYPFQQGWKVDDVKALCRIARHVQKRYHLSRKNTFLTGMSNGGEMCYLMAYSKQNVFRAVAPIAGLTMAWIYETKSAPHPIPLMEIHGTEDRVSEWTGDLENKGGWGAYLPVPVAVGYWVARNRCTHETVERVESLKGDKGHPVIKHRYSSPTTGCEVWLYEVVGGVHSWHTTDIDTGEEIWQFFSQYLK